MTGGQMTGPDSASLPIPLDRLTGIRIFGEEGVTPVDTSAAFVAVSGQQTWLCWQHYGVDHAVNLAHVIELVSQEGVQPAG